MTVSSHRGWLWNDVAETTNQTKELSRPDSFDDGKECNKYEGVTGIVFHQTRSTVSMVARVASRQTNISERSTDVGARFESHRFGACEDTSE
jgi:hypothetical protein